MLDDLYLIFGMIRCGAGAFSCLLLIVWTVLLLLLESCDAVVARSFASRCSLSFFEKFISKVPHLPPTWIKSDMDTSVLSMMPSSMDSVGSVLSQHSFKTVLSPVVYQHAPRYFNKMSSKDGPRSKRWTYSSCSWYFRIFFNKRQLNIGKYIGLVFSKVNCPFCCKNFIVPL